MSASFLWTPFFLHPQAHTDPVPIRVMSDGYYSVYKARNQAPAIAGSGNLRAQRHLNLLSVSGQDTTHNVVSVTFQLQERVPFHSVVQSQNISDHLAVIPQNFIYSSRHGMLMHAEV